MTMTFFDSMREGCLTPGSHVASNNRCRSAECFAA